MTDALTCVSFLKLDSVGVNTGGDRWFKGESSTGDKGRATCRAAGGGFLVPLSIVLLGVVVIIVGIGGASRVGVFTRE